MLQSLYTQKPVSLSDEHNMPQKMDAKLQKMTNTLTSKSFMFYELGKFLDDMLTRLVNMALSINEYSQDAELMMQA